MKKVKSFLFLIIGLLVFSSCHNDDDIIIEQDNTRYYVKYEVYFKTQYKNVDREITYSDEKGIQKITLSEWGFEKSWEGTYGPVNKDFVAILNCSTPTNYSSIIHAKIYVCREKEPFVIKAEASGENPLNLRYKIDF